MSAPRLPSFDELAHAVVADAGDAHDQVLGRLVTAARAAGVEEAALAVVIDRDRPEVVRLRALGRVVAALAEAGGPVAPTPSAAH